MEQWKQHSRFSDYEMSTEGNIRNIKTGRILKTTINEKGYERVCLRKDKKQYIRSVHRLIADTFIDGDHSDMNVTHKNDIRTDNRIENLEYATRSELDRKAFDRGTRKPPRQVRVRVIETGEEFESIRQCARVLGLNQSEICKCVNGVAYTCGGLHFERVD